MNARQSLDQLARFACENKFSSSAEFIRDLFKSIHSGSGRIEMAPLTRLDDEHAAALVLVLEALLVHQSERLYDVDLAQAFERHGGRDFFHEQPRPAKAASDARK